MREALGGAWLFGVVITFIVFFASFLAVSINFSRAFNVKNNIVDLVSKYEGNNKEARKKISSYLKDTGYLVLGDCSSVDDGYDYKGYNMDGELVSEKAYYCIASDTADLPSSVEKKFYRIVVFFKLDLPLFGDMFTFKIKGETEAIHFPNES